MTPDRTSDATEIRNSWDDDAAAAHPRPTSGPQSDEQPQKAPEHVRGIPDASECESCNCVSARLMKDVREGAGWTCQLDGVLVAQCDTYGKTEAVRAAERERDEARATIARVEALHVRALPVFNWQRGLRYVEPCPDCDGKAGVHSCGCWADQDTEYVCRECDSRPGTRAAWPCPTIAALADPEPTTETRPTSGPQSDEQPQKAPEDIRPADRAREAGSCSSECAAILAAHDSERRRALAERDALAATVRRVEALATKAEKTAAKYNPHGERNVIVAAVFAALKGANEGHALRLRAAAIRGESDE